ncbi:phosphate transporter PHO1 [Cynara cardunculus var. scolymus]|uniref:phosphate transporter PHO1 n=1 Tax=Cynara cardunculus var. scolymus TaxID=59895 RepID=UPI000D62FD0F|nr:phosphate transporter PHO1 [Cynara cardunculus var. scolymus]
MVKFSKQLQAQLIPEWKDAFVNYWQLKKHVKKVKLSRISKLSQTTAYNHDYGLSMFDPVRSFFSRLSCNATDDQPAGQILQVKNTLSEPEPDEAEDETELVDHLYSEEDEVKVFFEKLDEELDKVNQFYSNKESEFLERGEMLNKQLQILLDLQQVLDCRRRSRRLNSSGFLRSYSSSARNSDSETPTEFGESLGEQTDDVISALEKNGINLVGSAKSKKAAGKMGMRIDIPATTPTRTITAVTSMLWEDLVNNPKKEGGGGEFLNRKKLQCAEKMIRGAFVELYRGLGLLKTYSSLNMVAFVKILKKFDKVSNQQSSTTYLKAVKRSHFISSDKVVRLMDEVESSFTKHFAKDDRKKAMKFLRPRQHKDSHMVTFFVGLFTGSFVTLFTVYAILAHISGMFSPGTETDYVETIYPVFSMFALLSLHIFMYGCNLFLWKATRINYHFIFEFQAATALKYRDAFLICTCMMTAVVSAMVLHLILVSNGFSHTQVDTIPGILLLIFIGLLVCPLNMLYRPTRYCFLRVIRNIVFSPLYKVLMVDFFMADQLTSQIPLLRHMESTACYFLAGSFKTHEYQTCKSGKLYRELAYVISFAPYYWRAMQCARRWFDECDVNHLANLGKYVSAMVAAGARLTYARQETHLWLIIVLVTSLIATIYQLYWDFVKDWGLLDSKSKNLWLRDELVLKKRGFYYIAIALNFVLRVAWVETVLQFKVGLFESRLLEFCLASLEVIRRGHWNYYRLENEHLNNVGRFRAVKTVPLPFRETDSDG